MNVLRLSNLDQDALVVGLRELADVIEVNKANRESEDASGVIRLRSAMTRAAGNPTIRNLIDLGKARANREKPVFKRAEGLAYAREDLKDARKSVRP